MAGHMFVIGRQVRYVHKNGSSSEMGKLCRGDLAKMPAVWPLGIGGLTLRQEILPLSPSFGELPSSGKVAKGGGKSSHCQAARGPACNFNLAPGPELLML